MMKFPTPKRVTLTNGRTFLAKYNRVKRSELPPNIIKREELTRKELLLEVEGEE